MRLKARFFSHRRVRSTAIGALVLTIAIAWVFVVYRRRIPQPSSPRQATLLSRSWRFLPINDLEDGARVDLDDSGWTAVEIPHTWSVPRPASFRRAWYRARFHLPKERARGRTFLAFDGVSAIADVYVNGVHLGQHRGAYTRFVLDATRALVPSEGNVVAVRVSNDPEETEDCLPSGTGGGQHYHVFGGIHRKVWLLTTAKCHIDPTDYGAPGVAVIPRRVDESAAEFDVRVRLANFERLTRRLELRLILTDPGGAQAWSALRALDLSSGAGADVVIHGGLRNPRLWGLGHPELYVLHADLWGGGRLLDSLRIRTGFRDFRCVDDRFYLNGAPVLVRGIGKHEESELRGSAVTDDEIRRDFEELSFLGVNMVRLAHYPHSRLAYDLADELGLMVWAENGNSTDAKAGETGERITREMVRQNVNHPSIVVWGVGNESEYRGVDRYAAVVKAEDPSRPIAYATNTHARPRKRDLSFIAHNVYRGWYRGYPWEWEPRARAARMISECGAGSMISNHTDYGRAYRIVDRFEPEEYRQLVAEAQFSIVFGPERARFPLFLLWVMRDFAIDKYKGVVNTKGLLTRGGFRKDAYYLYQSFLRPELPVVHITSKTYFLRRGRADNGIKAYSNREKLRLVLNGRDAGVRVNGAYRHSNGRIVPNVFIWKDALRPGRNDLRVTDGAGHEDTAVVYFQPSDSSWASSSGEPIRDLRSANVSNRACFIDMPIRDEWPFYYEFDGSADNTFAEAPEDLRGAGWISTRRLSKSAMSTRLDFVIDPEGAGADVFIVYTIDGRPPSGWIKAGFSTTPIRGAWRDNDLQLVSFGVMRKDCGAGERIAIPAASLDYVVLVNRRDRT
jgi:beta-galactosidase